MPTRKRSPQKKQNPRSTKACISTYVGHDLYNDLKKLAECEGRSLSNLLLKILRQKFPAKGD
jgi:hypothetical protein